MIEALTLQRSTAQDKPLPAGTVRYYVRSWELSAEILQNILQLWEEDEYTPATADTWADQLITHPDLPLFVRYVDEGYLMLVARIPLSIRILLPGTQNQLIDDTERIIISFFQVEIMLNQQAGGYYVSYQPNLHITLCRELKFRYFRLREQGRTWAENNPQLDGWLDNLGKKRETRPFQKRH
ncbi:hypothetical protein EC973_009150 [Apophysomyces ossiformis]|uniref:Uncharacterized protein n=1 Tax=Apophysomyces ossiformis TaxID=679940 RepID=A0A8H7BK64_9FUNG|nr:hypothetical protein EC973_009150 [Apophysomyces ossiformis]